MTEDEFWTLIETIDTDALLDGDEESAVAPLVTALSRLDEAAIQQFEEQLALALYRLDGEKFADHAGDSGRSGDGFLYIRCFVVGCGREYFNEVLDDPTRMPDSIDDWFESLLYAAKNAWCARTGSDPEDEEWDYLTAVSYETGSNRSQW